MTELNWLNGEPAERQDRHRPQRPILLVALEGWFDAANVATKALQVLKQSWPIETLATIDPDGFYDFTQQRPTVALDDHEEPQVTWPTNEFVLLRTTRVHSDLVTLTGVEPHLRWNTYAKLVIEAALELDCVGVVTVGATADAVPHTRNPVAFASTTHKQLASRLGLSTPQYQGITGVVGVLQAALDEHDLFGVSLRVPVPYYLGNAYHPRSTAALLRYLEHILGLPTNASTMNPEIEHWQHLHDAAVQNDPEARSFVRALEADFDRRTEASIPSGEDLAGEFDRFLREQDAVGGRGFVDELEELSAELGLDDDEAERVDDLDLDLDLDTDDDEERRDDRDDRDDER